MLKRLWRLCLVAVIAAGTFSVSAPAAAPVAAAADTCGSTAAKWFAGNNIETFNFTSIKGVKAKITSGTKLQLCDGGFDPPLNQASAWIAVVPDVWLRASAIIQIGIIRDKLSNATYTKMFWAYGGCGGAVPAQPLPQIIPTAQAVGSNAIDLSIYYDSDGYWNLSYFFTNPDGSAYTGVKRIHHTHNDISCWIDNPVKGQIMGETGNSGNDIGYPDSHLYVRSIRFQVSTNGTWWYPSQKHSSGLQMGYPTNCDSEDDLPGVDDYHCTVPSSTSNPTRDSMDIWIDHV